MAVRPISPFTVINAGLALVCAVLAVLVVLALLREPAELQTGPLVNSLARQNIAWNWFPVTPVSPEMPVAQEQSEEYDEVNIRAELMGVIIAPGTSTATIRIGGQERVFRPGEEIQSGIEVSRIEPARVVVTQGGRTLQLSFPEREQRATVTRRSAETTSNSNSTTLQSVQLPNIVSADPVTVEGYNGGYRLQSVASDISAQADIREGDVVVRIGDLDIQTLQANPAQWVNLSTETALPVTVIRDGQEQTVYVNALGLSARLLPNLNQD